MADTDLPPVTPVAPRAPVLTGAPGGSGGRCFGDGDRLMAAYHDEEWGEPMHDERALFERLVLEGFQSGLSWAIVLRKRPAFREVFAGFDPAVVAGFGDDDVERLLADPRIVRNRAKIVATIANAQALRALHDAGRTLDAVLWSHAPTADRPRPPTWAQVPSTTPESVALARELKTLGFRFVGPTTAYAAMQACGVVDDHLVGCPVAARRGGGAPALPTPVDAPSE